MKNETLYGTDDGLPMNDDVGSWSSEKYRVVQLYAHIFTSSMKGKWKALAYVDLYAGAGLSKVKGGNDLLLGSPLIALSLDTPFDRYVFCEENPDKLSALRHRVSKDLRSGRISFVEGDCNQLVSAIKAAIPSDALTLCFVDPYRLDIRFQTIRELAHNRKIDFLCLLASRMDAGRNRDAYTKEESTDVDDFLGTSAWRERWEELKRDLAKHPNFGDFICKEFSNQMETLGYLPTELHEMKPIKTDAGVLLYHLALFTKNDRAKKFWAEATNYSHAQRNLF